MLAIKIDAGHDRSGNPRRGWIIARDDRDFIDFVDEGYQGNASLEKSSYGNVTSTNEAIEVTPSTYHQAYRQSYGAVEKQMKKENKLQRAIRRETRPR